MGQIEKHSKIAVGLRGKGGRSSAKPKPDESDPQSQLDLF
jgi:hypothetical protein